MVTNKSYTIFGFLNLWRNKILLDSKRSQLSEFLEPHIEKLYKQAYLYTNDPEAAEDLLQDLTLKVHANLDKLPEIKFPLSWLRRCLYNLFIDRYRRGKYLSFVEDVTPISDAQISNQFNDDQKNNQATPEQSFSQDYIMARVRQSIMSLSVSQRAVATLFFFENMSLQGIADQLGIALGTVKSRLHRARAHLTVELGDLMEASTESVEDKV